jgi:hypothetical protein
MVPVAGLAFVLPSPIYHPGVKVTQVTCGNEHCLLLTEAGQVFTWGTGRYADVSWCKDCLVLSCLQNWLSLLFSLGSGDPNWLYSGMTCVVYFSRGQLGHGDLENEQENARQVDSLAGLHVTQVAAGGWHSAAVTEWGDLYTWGWNHWGQLGFPMREVRIWLELNSKHAQVIIWDLRHTTEDVDCSLLVCNVMYPFRWLLALWRNTSILTVEMKMEAMCSSKTLINTYQTTWCHNTANHNLHTQVNFNNAVFQTYFYLLKTSFYYRTMLYVNKSKQQALRSWKLTIAKAQTRSPF